MHFLGKDMTLSLHYPDGSTKTLLEVPRFDFAWQTVYRFAEPVRLAPGTRVHMVTHHDNTPASPYQPSSPPHTVTFGEKSSDEMADGILFVARARGQGVRDTPQILGGARGERYRAGAPLEALIRFGPYGPPGIGLTWKHELGVGHVYYRSERDPETTAGVFLENPLSVGPQSYPLSELVHVIDGELTLSDARGRQETFGPGDTVLIPRGAEVLWRHDRPLRKIWAIFDHGDGAPVRERSFVRFRADAPLTTSDDGTREHVYYSAQNGKVSAGVWEADPFTVSTPTASPHSELMIVLAGSALLTQEDGLQGTLSAGEVVVLPRGTKVAWQQRVPLKKFYLAFDGD